MFYPGCIYWHEELSLWSAVDGLRRLAVALKMIDARPQHTARPTPTIL